jgi:hypothetical protein
MTLAIDSNRSNMAKNASTLQPAAGKRNGGQRDGYRGTPARPKAGRHHHDGAAERVPEADRRERHVESSRQGLNENTESLPEQQAKRCSQAWL